MPILVAILIGALSEAAAYIVGRVLIALSIGFVTFTGVNAALGFIKTQAQASMSTLSPTILGFVGLLKIGTVFSIIISALVIRATLKGLKSGSFKKMVTK
ncbi:MAG: putative minor coat protein [Pedosphaera sp.]|nr:putative minor coat protein [Pedosphaera sp.]